MNMIRTPRFWGILVLLVLVGGAGWWFFLSPGETETDGRELALGEELAKTRLYRVWKEKYPADYQEFLQARELASTGMTEAEQGDSLFSRSTKRLQRYLPYADDDSLLRFAEFTMRQYVAIQAISPIQCGLFAVGDKEFDTRLLKHIETNDASLSQAAMLDILADILSSNDPKRPIPSDADISSLRVKIQELTSQEDLTLLQQAQSIGGYPQVCQASLVLFRTVLKLPKEDAAHFLRFAFHTAFAGRDKAKEKP